ncbi:MAG: FIST C-terminal domain-containing protein [Betaproteobacteria bacterium]
MAATGLARGNQGGGADPQLAFRAVTAALRRQDAVRAGSVLLFLTGHFARDPIPAIHAAARAAQTTQIAGCTAVGVLTDEDWVIDTPAAAALVFAHETDLMGPLPALGARVDDWLLALAAPNSASRDWLTMPGRRVGALSGDGTGRGPFPVWSAGKLLESGRLDLQVPQSRCRVTISTGLTPLSSLLGVTEVRAYDLLQVSHRPALSALVAQALPHLEAGQPFPWHRLLLARADDEPRLALASGEYELLPVLGVNPNRSLIVGGKLLKGDRIFSVLREPQSARQELDVRLATGRTDTPPHYGMLFNCAGRGPAFFDGRDADWDSVRRAFPRMPLIGFYGNGEIAPIGGRNRLLQYASVCALIG